MRFIPASLFFAFVCWIILEANLSQYNTFIRIGHSVPMGDKIGHFLIYAVLSFLLNVALKFGKVRIFNWNVYTAPLLVLAFAVGEEFTQLGFASRTFDFADIFSDVLGISLSYVLSAIVELLLSKRPAAELKR